MIREKSHCTIFYLWIPETRNLRRNYHWIPETKNGAMGINCANNKNIFISDNQEEWIDIISKCISNFDLVKNISQNARSFSEIEFDYKSSAQKLLNYFKSN
jgi:hypothetical protein